MAKYIASVLGGLLLAVTQLASAAPGQPNFMPAIYGDGEVWGTKGTTNLPAPTANNTQSFDRIFVIQNHNDPNTVQLPVSEAAPGNPDYNGGRWNLQLVNWTPEGVVAHGGYTPVLKSLEDIMYNHHMGYLEIVSGGAYFQCPLLPVK